MSLSVPGIYPFAIWAVFNIAQLPKYGLIFVIASAQTMSNFVSAVGGARTANPKIWDHS